ncbi:hypothetical protein L228DRAFT_286405 [Xylona heveae TC161]|uniref:Uncharacterized protein n=1 Tax=Xylona heveae (strain CBS 132557 / TC161) TaxID=1328760 RepID=A0A164Z829_XYLHT|nr:hypothetical protein L228DRAFT_286405 [Xylona heveae TC161]KZF18802.1 hypothetical protein L228DRAFT_286405 [Xylona heveae TC161]
MSDHPDSQTLPGGTPNTMNTAPSSAMSQEQRARQNESMKGCGGQNHLAPEEQQHDYTKENLTFTDPLADTINSAYLGTVLVSIDKLNTNWGEGLDANRPLSESQVTNLVKIFTQSGLRKEEFDHRLVAGCDQGTWNRLVAKGNLSAAIVSQIRDGLHRFSTNLHEFHTINIDDENVLLYAGQHRRGAIIHICNTTENLTEEDKRKVKLWPCEFYDDNKLMVGAKMKLQENL